MEYVTKYKANLLHCLMTKYQIKAEHNNQLCQFILYK